LWNNKIKNNFKKWGVAPASTGQAIGKAPRRGGVCEVPNHFFKISTNCT